MIKKLIPNRGVTNGDVEELLRAVASFFVPPGRRWQGWRPAPPERASWEIVLTRGEAGFYFVVPEPWETVVNKQIAVVWPRAQVEESDTDPLAGMEPTAIGSITLKNHYMFGLKTRGNIIGSLLETTRMLRDGERVVVQIVLTPAPPDWWRNAAEAYEGFKKGKMPGRVKLDPQSVTQYLMTGIAYAAMEAVNITTELITGSPSDVSLDGPSKALAMQDRPIGSTVSHKLKQDALDVTIRVGVQAESPESARGILRSVGFAFKGQDSGDNGFDLEESMGPHGFDKMQRREPTWEKWLNRDYMTLEELTTMICLPDSKMQEEFGLKALAHNETPNLPASVRKPGLLLGTATWKGQPFPVYQATENLDEMRLPRCVIGPMGCGKTRGYGANLAVEAVERGDYAVILDPAKGEMGDECEAYFKAKGLPGKVQRFRFDGDPSRLISLDWRECRHDQVRGRNKLAQQLITFCDAATDEAGAQTVRYLRSAAKAVPTGRLSEVIQLLTDTSYIASLLNTMPERERATWTNYMQLSDARRSQIASPVLNRLDVVMGDDYLADCMDAQEGIDFVELLDDGNPRVIVLDVPKGGLGPEGMDVLAALLATKLDVAMVTRKNTDTTVFIIMDEPHQYLRSARTWKSVAVESRKWGFAYTWMFHSWEQIPAPLAEIIKSAGPHYHIYASSTGTFNALKHELAPWTAEEGVRLPRFHAINAVWAGGLRVAPFLANMALPPSKRLPKKGD